MASNQATIVITARDDAKGVLDGIGRSLGTLKGGAEDAGRGVGTLGGALDGLRPHLSTIAGITLAVTALHAALGLLGNAAGFLKNSFLGINQQLDSAKVAFTGMLGSGQAATAMLQTLQTLAAQTPFEFPQLVTATQHLMSFGFSAGQVIPLLKDIGNASSYFGTGAEGINRMVLAIGQMHAGVVLHTQDLDELQKMVANGQIASDTFLTYFDQWVQKTPGVADAMQKQSTTFAGAMSTIHDNATMAIATGLRPLFDLITEGANVVARFTEGARFQEWVQLVSEGARRAADDIRALFATFQAGGIDGALDSLKAKVTGFFDSFAGENAHTGGFNFIVTFAQGMYDAAQSVLSTVVSDIAQSIGDFFIGHSPPPKGPLSGILEGGAKTMEAFLDGMRSAVEGGGVSDIGGRVFATLNEALTGGSANIDFSALTDAIRSGALSMDELKVAGEGVDDVVRTIGESITDLQDKQDVLKGQIEDIQFSYQDQIDPLQKALDSIKNIVDWTTKRRDLELEIADNRIQQQEANDPTLAGLTKTLAGLQQQQRSSRTAPVDRTLENQIAGLQRRERGLPTGQAGAAQRKQIEDQIAGLREKQRVEKDGDTDAARALQARIDGVKQEIDDRKAGYQQQLDANKAEKDRTDLAAKGLELQRQLQALPLEQKIAGLKQAEADRIAPLQRQYDLLDRQRGLLERQKSHWTEIGAEIKDALQPLQQALDAQNKADAEAKKAAAAGAKTPALPGGGLLGIKPDKPGPSPKTQDFNTEATKGLAKEDFDNLGTRIGEGITKGAISYIKEHFGSLIGGAIGGALGGAVLGPVGALIGGLLGSRIGGDLQKKLGGLDWKGIFGNVEEKVAPIFNAVAGVAGRIFMAFQHGGLGGAARQAFSEVTSAFDSLLGWLGEKAPVVGNKLLEWGRQFVEFIKPHIGPTLEALGGLLKSVLDWVVEKGPAIRQQLGSWANQFTEWIGPKIPGILAELGKLWAVSEKWMGETALAIGKKLLDWGEQFVEWVAPKVPPLLKELGNLAGQFFGWIGEQAPHIVSHLEDWAKKFTEWVGPKIPGLLAELGKLAGKVLGWVAEQLPTLELKLLEWAAKFTGWILTVWPTLLTELAKLGTDILSWIKNDALPKLGQQLLDWAGAFKDWIKDVIKDGPDGIKGKLGGVLTAVGDWAKKEGVAAIKESAKLLADAFGEPFQAVKTLLATELNLGIGVINTFLGAVQGGINKIGELFGIDKLSNLTIKGVPKIEIEAPKATSGGSPTRKATGDMNFGGGPAIIGEAGRELFHRGNGWEMAERATMLHLPKGATVLPNAITEALLRMGVPGFAGGLLGGIGDAVGTLGGAAMGLVGQGAQAIYDHTVGALPDLNLPGILHEVGGAVGKAARDGLMELIKGILPNVRGAISSALTGAPFGNVTPGSGVWHNPVPGYRAVQGSWTHGGTHDREAAVDWATPLGTSILAPDGGFAGTVWNGDGATGRTGIIDHGNGWLTYFGHVRDFAFGAVRQDMAVGHTGSPEEDGGAGSGAHLHFAMRLHGAYERPEDYIPGIFGLPGGGDAPTGPGGPRALATGGITQDEGVYHLHPREAVIPLDSPRGRDLAGGGGDIIFQPGAIVVQGTVVTERDLVDAVHTGLLRKKNEGQRLNLS
jgi:hypothetical protein